MFKTAKFNPCKEHRTALEAHERQRNDNPRESHEDVHSAPEKAAKGDNQRAATRVPQLHFETDQVGRVQLDKRSQFK